MRLRNVAVFSVALLAGAVGATLLGPHPAEAVAREIIELQRDVTALLQGQKDMATQITQDHTVMKTLVEQSADSVGKLNGTMSSLQKSVQDVQANAGARLDTMSTQVQGLSDNLEEIKSRLGKLNQQLVDLQNTVQSLDAKMSGTAPSTPAPGGAASLPPQPTAGPGTPLPTSAPAGGAAVPSANKLYENGLSDIYSGKYDLARQEFQDYLKYYGQTELASNAQFYLGEIDFRQKKYSQAVADYDRVLIQYPKSFKLAPARLKKALALIELGDKTQGIRELREVIKRHPSSEEERVARARLKELGVSTAASAQ
jgi:tol-pal system protein YbgF